MGLFDDLFGDDVPNEPELSVSKQTYTPIEPPPPKAPTPQRTKRRGRDITDVDLATPSQDQISNPQGREKPRDFPPPVPTTKDTDKDGISDDIDINPTEPFGEPPPPPSTLVGVVSSPDIVLLGVFVFWFRLITVVVVFLTLLLAGCYVCCW